MGKQSSAFLQKLYVEDKLSTYEIASRLGVSASSIGRWLHDLGIPTRKSNEANLLSIPKRRKAILLTCSVCRKEFYRRPSVVAPYKSHYCSTSCMGEAKRGMPMAEIVGATKARELSAAVVRGIHKTHPRLSKICLHCRQSFTVQFARGKAKYCSRKCQIEGQWTNPTYLAAVQKKPTKPEEMLIDLLEKHFPQFKYNGDARLGVVLNRLVPDFINVDGNKQVIEVFGDYYHGKAAKNWKCTDLGRQMAYNSLGYKCLVLWEGEIKSKSEQDLVETIRKFERRR